MHRIIIAIDGFAACGKSTLARQLADALHYIFLDTGAMYRAVCLYCMRNHVHWQDAQALEKALREIHLRFEKEDGTDTYKIYLNEENVEPAIRSTAVSNRVSEIAALSPVRSFLVARQREIGSRKGIVMDGRDIGTVVFPDAELKIFVTAAMEVRVERRWKELQQAGANVSREQIRQNLEKRDFEETTRADSPLRMAEDAILLDNSSLGIDEQLAWALEKVRAVTGN